MRKRMYWSEKEAEIPVTQCPYCGYMHDHAEIVGQKEKAVPRPGDVSVCYSCYRPAIFGNNLQPRKPTFEESIEIANCSGIQEAIKLIKVERSDA